MYVLCCVELCLRSLRWWENKLLFINWVAIYFCANIWMKIILLPVISPQSSMICFSFLLFSSTPIQSFPKTFHTTKFFVTDSLPLQLLCLFRSSHKTNTFLWYGISIFCQTSVKYAWSFWSAPFNFGCEFKRNFTFLYMWYFRGKQFLLIFSLSLVVVRAI